MSYWGHFSCSWELVVVVAGAVVVAVVLVEPEVPESKLKQYKCSIKKVKFSTNLQKRETLHDIVTRVTFFFNMFFKIRKIPLFRFEHYSDFLRSYGTAQNTKNNELYCYLYVQR